LSIEFCRRQLIGACPCSSFETCSLHLFEANILSGPTSTAFCQFCSFVGKSFVSQVGILTKGKTAHKVYTVDCVIDFIFPTRKLLYPLSPMQNIQRPSLIQGTQEGHGPTTISREGMRVMYSALSSCPVFAPPKISLSRGHFDRAKIALKSV